MVAPVLALLRTEGSHASSADVWHLTAPGPPLRAMWHHGEARPCTIVVAALLRHGKRPSLPARTLLKARVQMSLLLLLQ